MNCANKGLIARKIVLITSAIALLKEQEAVAPTLDETTKSFYRCGVC